MKQSGRSPDLLKKLYYDMVRIRRTEEKLTELYTAGHIAAPIHLSIGQEAVAVGVMAALKPEDKIVSTHRCHGHYLAKGGDMKRMFAEILGKATGCCSGRGGTMHIFDEKAGHVVSTPLVGASISFAVGLALSFKMKGEDKIAAAFFGDGAVEEGIFWESINFASVHKLPVLFVCENNLYATHSPILARQPSDKITPRVEPHLFDVSDAYRIADANNVLLAVNIAQEAVEKVRKGRPCFIEARTYRFKEHWGVGEDWDLGYRSKAELDYWLARCPIKQLREFLMEKGLALSDFEKMEVSVKNEIEEAVKFAFESPEPMLENLIKED